ncbi:hypothetical protein, partial [Streptomyces sp. NPDC060022]|uniref:hypothetical protein n=1 Tax=Streptomyces sp. NPDC060022 TaxID=3347039 RepID=UPI0036B319BB
MGLYPQQASLRVAGVSHRREAATGKPYVLVTLVEVAQELPARVWDRDIVTRPVIQPSSGEQLGITGDLGTICAPGHFFLDARTYSIEDPDGTLSGSYPLPWVGGGEFFVWDSHSDGRGFSVATPYGPKVASPAEVGRYLRQLLAVLRPGRKVELVLYSCSAGRTLPGHNPPGLGVASWSGHRTTAPTETIGSEGEDPKRYEYFVVGDRSGNEPRWRSFDPLARGTGTAAPGGVSGVNRERGVPRFDAMEGTDRWEEVTRGYESALGRALAADPEVIGTAREAVNLSFDRQAESHGRKKAEEMFLPLNVSSGTDADAAMRRLLDADSDATLDELMQAFRRSQTLGRGTPSLSQLLTGYFKLVGGADDESHTALRSFRKALLGWLLPGNEESLSEIVCASDEAGLRDAREVAALVGEAADLYVWAGAEFAPGGSAGVLPHHAGYLDHAGWFTSEVSGDGAVPGGVWSALETGVRSLGADGAVAQVPQGDDPGVPRKSWVARQEALRAWVGRHEGSPLAGLHASHVLALYLLGGADRVFLDARFVDFEPSREVWELLGRETRSVVVWSDEGGGRFPFLLMRDSNFRSTVRPQGEDADEERDALVARAEDLLEQVLGEIPEHRAMVLEALGLLPPVVERVWLLLPGLGDLTSGDLDALTVSALRVGSLDEGVARSGLVGGDLLVEVESSSAVDVSVFSPDPERREAVYGRDMVLRVVHREVVQDPVAGAYEFVRVEESGREDAGQSTSLAPEPAVDASALPGPGVWNSRTATTKQERKAREQEEQRSAHWNTGPAPKKQRHEGEATAVASAPVRPRFPDFYSDARWAQESRDFERALGQDLSDSKKAGLLFESVWALFDVLAEAHGEDHAASAFFGPGTEDSAAAWHRLTGPEVSRSGLMDAFVNAAYANVSSPYTLSKLWAARPELNTRLLPLRPSDAVPYDESDPGFLDRRDRRGLLMTSAPATEAEWLLRVYQSLKIPAHLNEPLDFRIALLARALRTGKQSLFEILEASQRAGVRDDTVPDLAEIDAARLHAWADTLQRAVGLSGIVVTATVAKPVLPHRGMYAKSIGWLTAAVTGTRGVLRYISGATGVAGAPGQADQYPVFREMSEIGVAEKAARRAALQIWLRRHLDVALLQNVRLEHVPALYLASSADGALLRAVSGDGAVDAELLRAAAEAVVREALAAGASDGALLLLLLRDQSFREKLAEIRAVGGAESAGSGAAWSALVDLAGELAGGLSGEVGQHREMALEAVSLLPPVLDRVWWASRVSDVPLVGSSVSVPALHGVALSESAAVQSAPGVGGEADRLVVWEVADSTARDVSPFARDPRVGVGLYPQQVSLRVAGVSYRREAATGKPYVLVTLVEVAQELPARVWDRDIVTRPLIQPSSGEQLGITGDLGTICAPGHFFLDVRTYSIKDPDGTLRGSYPLPWVGGGEFFVWDSHSDGRGFVVASRYGHKQASPAEVGRHLKQVLAALRPGRKVELVLYSCSSGRKLPGLNSPGLGVASWSGYRTTAPERVVGSLGMAQNPYHFYISGDRSGPAPGWLSFEPLARRVGAAAGGVSGVNQERAVPRFRAMEETERWQELARQYENALGHALSADPQVIGTARDALNLLFKDLENKHGSQEAQSKFLPPDDPDVAGPDAAMSRLLDAGSGATLDELMQSFERAVVADHGNQASLPQLITRYSGLVPVAAIDASRTAFRDFRRVLLGWLLPGNRESLSTIVLASYAAGLVDAAESAVLFGEAADLYVWADAELAPRGSAGGVLPHRARYLGHAFTSGVSGDGTVPGGVWSAVEAGVRSLGSDGTVAEVPAASEQTLMLPRRSWVARQGALAAWVGRHGGSPLEGLHASHVLALYLLGGADRAFLDAGFVSFERSQGLRELLGREVRSAVVRAVEGGGRFPFLLTRDAAFRELAGRWGAVADGERGGVRDALLARADELVDGVLGEVAEHRAMVLEALGLLPPVGESVWLRLPGLGDLNPESDLGAVSVSALRVGSLDEGVARSGLVGGDLLVEVESSSAVDVSVFSPDPERREAVYGRDMVLRVVHREVVQDPAAGAYEFVRVVESGPEDTASTERPAPTPSAVDASELPGPGVWNSGPEPKKQKREHEAAVTTADPAVVDSTSRYPDFYGTDSWHEVSERYERMLGHTLSADPQVRSFIRNRVRAVHQLLSDVHGSENAWSAFWPETVSDPEAAALELLSEETGAYTLMKALISAVYANDGSPYTLRKLWSEQPELNSHHVSLAPVERPHDEADGESPDSLVRRGLRLTGGSAESVEILLGAYQAWDPRRYESPLQFRDALLAWALTTGKASMFEVLSAAHRLGVRGADEPDMANVDGARLYAWADGGLDLPHRLQRSMLPRESVDLLESMMVLPHRFMYWEATRWLTNSPDHAGARSVIVSMITSEHPQFDDGPSGDMVYGPQREEAYRAWVRRHHDTTQLRLRIAYMPALYLMTGADGALLRAVSGDGAVDVALLRAAADAVVQAALALDGDVLDGVLPLLLQRDEAFRDKLAEVRAVGDGAAVGSGTDGSDAVRLSRELADLVDGLADGLSGEVRQHREMALEAVGLLPPMLGAVWWASWAADVPVVGASVSVPALHGVALSEQAAVRGVAGVGGEADRLVVWEVADSTARDVTPFARDPRAGVGLYSEETSFQVVAVSHRQDAAHDERYTHVMVEEVAKELPARVWDRDVITHPVIHPDSGEETGLSTDGEDLARFFFDQQEFSVIRNVQERYLEVFHPVPWQGEADLFMFSAHSEGLTFQGASQHGNRYAGAAEVGRHLKQLLAALRPGQPVRLVLHACLAGRSYLGLGREGTDSAARKIADWSGFSTYAANRVVLLGISGHHMALIDGAGESGDVPGWSLFEPRGRAAARAGDRAAVRGLDGRTSRYRSFEGTERWEALTLGYEDALGQVLAKDTRAIAAARSAVGHVLDESVFPAGMVDVAAVNALLAGEAGLPELMEAFDGALRARGTGSDALLPRLFDGFYGLAKPSDVDIKDFRTAVLGWVLPGNRERLFKAVRQSHASGLKVPLEQALLAEGANLYEWADAEFRPRESAPAGSRLALELPHRARYEDHSEWFTGAVSGDGTVPGGVWSAVEAGVRSLGSDGTVAEVPAAPGHALVLPRLSEEARQGALAAWVGRHGGSPLAGLHLSHVLALYLLGGADRAFLDARFADAALRFGRVAWSSEARELLGREVRSVVVRAVEGGGRFPFLLMRDAE